MKILVKSTPAAMFLLNHQEVVEPFRPSVVTGSGFVDSKIAAGTLKLLAADLPDTASDSQFAAHWRSSGRNEALAVESYLSTFRPVETPTEKKAAEPLPLVKAKK